MARHRRLRGHRAPAAGTRPPRGPRRRAARRTRPGQDPPAALARRPAGRMDPGHRGLRARRAPLRPDHPRLPAAGRRARRRPAGRLAPPRRALHREARHPRHRRGRPHRRRRPGQGRRGPFARRPRDDPLRPRAPRAPRHRGHQRAARPRRTHPGVAAQRDGGARHPGPRLHAAAAAGRAARRLGQPGGLHQPRADHHTAEGPVRRRGAHALPAGAGRRDRARRPGGRRWSPTCPDTCGRWSPGSPGRCASPAPSTRARACRPGSRWPPPRPSPPPRCAGPRSPGEPRAVARPVDLESVPDVLRGKLEFASGEEGREAEHLEHLLRRATADTARARLRGLDLTPSRKPCPRAPVRTGERVPAAEVVAALPTGRPVEAVLTEVAKRLDAAGTEEPGPDGQRGRAAPWSCSSSPGDWPRTKATTTRSATADARHTPAHGSAAAAEGGPAAGDRRGRGAGGCGRVVRVRVGGAERRRPDA